MEYNLIYNRAWSFHKTTGIELEELIAEATLAYLIAKQNYEKDKGASFITYAYKCINSALIEYQRKLKKFEVINDPSGSLDWIQNGIDNIKESTALNLSKFSDNVRQIIQYVLDHQDEFDLNKNLGRANRGKIARAFLEEGWNKTKIYKAINELKQILNNTPENELFS